MDTFQVQFKCFPDPKNKEGILLKYVRVGSISHQQSPQAVTFASANELDSAFIAVGIYLHTYSHTDPERDARPDPEQNYEVTEESLRKLGFDIPSPQS
jgi:hypothetical protein